MLGISIYPEKASCEKICEYIDLASGYGYRRIFTCLLSSEGNIDEIMLKFKRIISYGRSKQMEVYVDVAPSVFKALNIRQDDLAFFNQLGVSGIRLDQSFNGSIEAMMSHNEYDLNIEINMSQDTHILDTIFDYKPKPGKIIGCHNFYPQRYTGLNLEYFKNCCERFKKHYVRSAAFVSSNSGQIGPWQVMDGLCTLEMHRDMKLTTQVKHLYGLNLIDDIIIANMFATKEELEAVASLKPGMMEFNIELYEPNALESKIIFEHEHFNRGDINDYIIRSTMPRVTYKDEQNPPHHTNNIISRGTVVIGNDRFGQYKNELQIITAEIIDQDGMRNIVGKICEEEMFLLDLLEPWQHFKFKNKR